MKNDVTQKTEPRTAGTLDSVVRPIRVQRKRTKGWKMPPNTVSVCRPGKWGNPFRVGDGRDPGEAVNAYEWWIRDQGGRHLLNDLHQLRGKNLACYCPLDQACHADVLLDLANDPVDLTDKAMSLSMAKTQN